LNRKVNKGWTPSQDSLFAGPEFCLRGVRNPDTVARNKIKYRSGPAFVAIATAAKPKNGDPMTTAYTRRMGALIRNAMNPVISQENK